MIVFSVLCVLFALVMRTWVRGQQQRKCVEQLRGSVFYSFEKTNDTSSESPISFPCYDETIEPKPNWLTQTFGTDFQHNIEAVSTNQFSPELVSLFGLGQVTKIRCNFSDVDNLTPIQCLKKLEWLSLVEAKVDDFGPLRHCTRLTHLDLSRTKIVDLSICSHMKDLERLDVGGTQVTDISPLEKLTQLTHLDLGQCEIKDLSPLKHLKKLEYLSVRFTDGCDFSALAGLPNIKHLTVAVHYQDRCSIPNLDCLGRKPQLNHLYVSNCCVNDLDILKGSDQLEFLSLEGPELKNLNALKQLTRLKSLYLRADEVTDLSPLAKLKNLEVLDGTFPKAKSILPLAELRKLKRFTLRQISCFDELAELEKHGVSLKGLSLHKMPVSKLKKLPKSLEWLELNQCDLNGFSFQNPLLSLMNLDLLGSQMDQMPNLAMTPNLVYLDLSKTNVKDLSSVAHLTKLETLGLEDTSHLKSIRPIANLTLHEIRLRGSVINDVTGMPKVQSWPEGSPPLIDLARTQLVDPSPLSGPVHCQLDLSGTPIKDFSKMKNVVVSWELLISQTGLKDLSNLHPQTKLLDISGTQVTDLSPLESWPNLLQVTLRDTPVSKEEIERFKTLKPDVLIVK